MQKLFPVLVLLAFSIGCSNLQQRWPDSNGAAHNEHAITTEIEPSTPAAESMTRKVAEVEPIERPAKAPSIDQGNYYDPRTHGTTSGELQ